MKFTRSLGFNQQSSTSISSEEGTISTPHLSGHIPALDGLRGIAILLVMVVHYQSYLPQSNRMYSWILKVGEAGWIGVDLFFVLSGFLITGILLRDFNSPHYFRNFYIRRILRIFPLYYIVLLVSCVFLPIIGITYVGSDKLVKYQLWLWLFSPNIISSIKQQWIFHNSGANLGHFWSLAVEEHFYLVWPALVFFFKRHLLAVCLFIMGIGILSRLYCVWLHLPPIVSYTLTICRMDALAVGSFVAIIANRERGIYILRRWSPLIMAFCGSILLLFFILHKGLWLGNDMVRSIGFSLLDAFFASFLIIAITFHPLHWIQKLLSGRFLRFFGKYSYSLYVFHPMLEPRFHTIFSVERISSAVSSNFFGSIINTFLCILLTIPFSLLSWHLIEKPFLNLKNRFSNSTVV